MNTECRFKELIVWQKAMDLVDEVYLLQRGFPKPEVYGLGDQLRRAAVSIPSNIAEGHGRGSRKDYVHFLSIARGSVYETITQLNIAKHQGYLKDISLAESHANEIARMLNALIRSLAPKPPIPNA